MKEVRIASCLITLFRKKVKGSPLEAWIDWRETLPDIFSENNDSAVIHNAVNAGKKDARRKDAGNWVTEELQKSTQEECNQIAALFEFYRKMEENQDGYIPGAFNETIFNEFYAFIPEGSRETAKETANSWVDKKRENTFYLKLKIRGTLNLILMDFVLRWFTLYFYTISDWNILIDSFGMDKLGLFMIVQCILIPAVISIYAIYRSNKVSLKTKWLIEKTGKSNIRLATSHSAWSYLLTVLFVLFGILIFTFLIPESPLIVLIIIGLLYFIYLFTLLQVYSREVPGYKNLSEQINFKEHRRLQSELSHDENDEELVALEVSLKSANEKMNTYVIEAALFGALAFSGFLTLISSGDFTISHLAEFNNKLMQLIHYTFTFQLEGHYDLVDQMLTKESLFGILSYESLFCSIFFLSVIASRLRVSKITDAIDKSIQIARAYNEKEEEFIEDNKDYKSNPSFQKYNEKIKDNIRNGFQNQDLLDPIIAYMQFFRNLGIGTFFFIIITSGLFISSEMTVLLFLIASLSLSYFYFNKIRTWLKSVGIRLQEFYFRHDKSVHWFSWSLIVLALVLRSVMTGGIGGIIMVFGFLILFLHYLMNLIIPIEIADDEELDDIQLMFRKTLQYIFKVSLAVFFLGYTFKALHWPGASAMLLASLILLAFYYIFVKKTIGKIRWLNIVLTIQLSLIFFSFLFKIQHWPGNTPLIWAGTLMIPVTLVLFFYYHSKIRKFILTTFYIIAVMLLCFWNPFLRWGIMNLSFNYEAFEKSTNIEKYFRYFTLPVAEGGFADASGLEDLKMLDKKIQEFEELYVNGERSEDYEFLNEISWLIYEKATAMPLLEAASRWSKKSIELNPGNWMLLDTYAALLTKLGRCEEALPYARKAYEIGKDAATKALIDKCEAELDIEK